MNVVVLGASNRPEKYAHMAFQMLRDHGHTVLPVNPILKEIDGVKVYPSIKDVKEPVDTVTLYVGPATSSKLIPEILAAQPRRIIFNPGAENPELEAQASEKGIETVEGCTLVMLRTQQF